MDISSVSDLDFNESGELPFVIKMIVVLLLCGVVLGLGYFFIVNDKEIELNSLQQKEISLRKEFETKQAKAVNLGSYKEQMKKMEVTFSSMLQQLPRKIDVADLLIDISRTGLENGLEVNLFKPSDERPIDFYAEIPIQMTVVGTYHQFGSFVSAIAALPRIVTLHNLTLTPKGSKMTMNIAVKTYRYFDEE